MLDGLTTVSSSIPGQKSQKVWRRTPPDGVPRRLSSEYEVIWRCQTRDDDENCNCHKRGCDTIVNKHVRMIHSVTPS